MEWYPGIAIQKGSASQSQWPGHNIFLTQNTLLSPQKEPVKKIGLAVLGVALSWTLWNHGLLLRYKAYHGLESWEESLSKGLENGYEPQNIPPLLMSIWTCRSLTWTTPIIIKVHITSCIWLPVVVFSTERHIVKVCTLFFSKITGSQRTWLIKIKAKHYYQAKSFMCVQVSKANLWTCWLHLFQWKSTGMLF